MTISLKHAFQSAVADGGDTSLVRPSNWNAEHDLTLATDTVLGRATAGTGAAEEIACTAAGRALLDDADAAAQRTTLGLAIGTNVQAYSAALGQIAGLSDPNADTLVFWDDSASSFAHLTLGTNLSITGTTINASGGSGISRGAAIASSLRSDLN